MGQTLNEKVTLEDRIEYIHGKMIGTTNSIKKTGSETNVGVEEVRVRLQL